MQYVLLYKSFIDNNNNNTNNNNNNYYYYYINNVNNIGQWSPVPAKSPSISLFIGKPGLFGLCYFIILASHNLVIMFT